jgi:cytochrome P450
VASGRFPDGPKSRFPGDLLFRLRRDPLAFLIKCAGQYGDVTGFRLGTQPFVFLNHPDGIRDLLVTNQKNFTKGRALERARLFLGNGLLTNEGESHLKQRRLAQPAFHRDRIAGYAASMVQFSARVRDRWHDTIELDVHEAMMALTLAIVGKTLFDADVEGEAGEIGKALTDVMAMFSLQMLPYSNIIQKLPLPAILRGARGKQRLDATIFRIIAERRATGGDRGDLLSMLMLSTDEDGSGMDDQQLRDEAMTLFLAGHETTANLLTWAWYALARNRDVEAKLHAEVDALGHEPTFADIPKLEYTRRVVAETMRLFPPAYSIGRRSIGEYEIGDYLVPARSIVLVSPYTTHRDSRWFADPERFDPDRWSAEETAKRPKFSYFPFSAGTRICIGEQFAWTEAILVLATLAQQWRLWLAPKQRIALQPRITLRPKYGMHMIATRR